MLRQGPAFALRVLCIPWDLGLGWAKVWAAGSTGRGRDAAGPPVRCECCALLGGAGRDAVHTWGAGREAVHTRREAVHTLGERLRAFSGGRPSAPSARPPLLAAHPFCLPATFSARLALTLRPRLPFPPSLPPQLALWPPPAQAAAAHDARCAARAVGGGRQPCALPPRHVLGVRGHTRLQLPPHQARPQGDPVGACVRQGVCVLRTAPSAAAALPGTRHLCLPRLYHHHCCRPRPALLRCACTGPASGR